MSTPSSSSVVEPSPSSNLNLHEEGSEVQEGDALQAMLDLVMMVLTMAAVSSATAIGYLGREGNVHTGWSQDISCILKAVRKRCELNST
ncbi:hypothetical protein J5N97_022889 [Dioscorea zingiberensis]|uniref:CASP-like protein n=1 Tax=Dioscorea zingiberensis TaxID=325984 RepID=A0A9D5CBA9_9LILI|nr:hypothetical protein J5N97_022889 [Dioscorea zingiberensis]